MKFKDLDIDIGILSFFRKNVGQLATIDAANLFIKERCGIHNFFTDTEEVDELKNFVTENLSQVEEPNRREYGDFQTNIDLTHQIARYISSKAATPEFIVEPTCGKGTFIIACLNTFNNIKKITAIEIYEPYVWDTKFNILKFFLDNPQKAVPDIDVVHANVFDFDFKSLSNQTSYYETLVIGNPPWVTNSELGSINSKNLPEKSNFKRLNGFDAITGKGNFDIGEYIALLMVRNFTNHKGYFGFLVKNSVAKNLIYDQKRNKYRIGNTEKLNIDSKKEFNVSVRACLFLTILNQEPDLTCREMDFYTLEELTVLGWHKDKFVYSVSGYDIANDIDGKSQFVWRQGVKHDCSKVMEIEQHKSHYINRLNEEVNIEKNLLYGLLKSSDLKGNKTSTYRKLTIITQKKIGQDTSYIKRNFPLTYKYLLNNKEYFDKRKSSIYNGKPDFSIFGIGDYSFAPYKIAISGLYKSTYFTLVIPDKNGKPIMLDDTCYFIGFDNLTFARIAHFLLNHEHTQVFLKSIIFPDAKRRITKDTLMRIDFKKLFELFDFSSIEASLKDITVEDWDNFGAFIGSKITAEQQVLF